MKRSKRKERKRREEYNKAVKHKMESAADLADKYSQIYDYSEKAEKAHRKNNNRVVKRKLLYSVVNVCLQSFALILVISILFMPFRRIFKSVLDRYFSAKKPTFSQSVANDTFKGSTNKVRSVEYADIEQPDENACYAELESRYVNSKIYFGISEEGLIKGICQDSKTSMPGFNRTILLEGYSGMGLEKIDKFKNGDKITVTTNYGIYTYKVTESGEYKKSSEVPYNIKSESEQLIITTDYKFDITKMDYTETYYLIALKVSGPEIVY